MHSRKGFAKRQSSQVCGEVSCEKSDEPGVRSVLCLYGRPLPEHLTMFILYTEANHGGGSCRVGEDHGFERAVLDES